MSSLSQGQLVKIKQEAFGPNPKYDDMYGDLGYVGVFMHFIFEIVRVEKDSARGEIAWCKITNPDALIGVVPGLKKVMSEGELVLLMKDIEPANTKTTLDYIVEEIPLPNKKEIEALFEARKKLRKQGKAKESAEMRKNWSQIQAARAATVPQAKVLLPKNNMFFILNKSELPNDSEKSIKKFKASLVNRIRTIRRERKEFNSKELKVVDVFGVGVERRGGVFSQPGSLLKAYEESLKTSLETPKKPVDTKANYVGIEIEFVYRGDYNKLKQLLIANKLHRFVDLTEDGSLRVCHSNSGYQTREMRVIAKVGEVDSVLKRLAKVFASPYVDAYVNRSCGLHVHLDMRNRDVNRVYKNLVRVQNLLRGSQPVGRINNTHCKPNVSDKISFDKTGDRHDRYSVINPLAYEKHKTLEVRIHEGTVECDNIFNWVMFLDAIANHTKEIPVNKIMRARELAEAYAVEIPEASIKYIDYRIEKFDSLSVG